MHGWMGNLTFALRCCFVVLSFWKWIYTISRENEGKKRRENGQDEEAQEVAFRCVQACARRCQGRNKNVTSWRGPRKLAPASSHTRSRINFQSILCLNFFFLSLSLFFSLDWSWWSFCVFFFSSPFLYQNLWVRSHPLVRASSIFRKWQDLCARLLGILPNQHCIFHRASRIKAAHFFSVHSSSSLSLSLSWDPLDERVQRL